MGLRLQSRYGSKARSRWCLQRHIPTGLCWNTPERRLKRQTFIEELISAMPVYPVTVAIALRAGQLDGENQAQGLRFALPDLLIGVTALELGFGVGTSNVRHFGDVPGLSVLSL